MLGPRVLSVADVEALADVPPRDVLLARLAGGFQAPLVKAAGLFQAFTRNFAYGLKAYIDIRGPTAQRQPHDRGSPGRRPRQRRSRLRDSGVSRSGRRRIRPWR